MIGDRDSVRLIIQETVHDLWWVSMVCTVTVTAWDFSIKRQYG